MKLQQALAFCSGLWVPVAYLPEWMQGFAKVLPPFHLAQLARHAVGVAQTEPLTHVAALAGCSAVFAVLVVVGWRRMQRHL